MNILVVCDSFKGSISSYDIGEAVKEGITLVDKSFKVTAIPVADGGEGTVEALVSGLGGKYKTVNVTGPLSAPVLARYGILQDEVAVIEMAEASGLPLVPENLRNPLMTTTYGTGELIKDALDNGCKKIFLGIGGSATNDGGVGMAQALGVSFQDRDGKEIGFGGGKLGNINYIDISNIDPRIKDIEIIVACDVDNPLCGINGASNVYGVQKGANELMIKQLDDNLKHLALKIKEQLGIEVLDLKGGGAAGGLGAGLVTFCGATLRSGIEIILDMVKIEKYLEEADIVITGEGKIDGQSINGKVPLGVANRAKKYSLPVIAITGYIGEDASKCYDYGIDSIFGIADKPLTLEESMTNSYTLIKNLAKDIFRFYQSVEKG